MRIQLWSNVPVAVPAGKQVVSTTTVNILMAVDSSNSFQSDRGLNSHVLIQLQ